MARFVILTEAETGGLVAVNPELVASVDEKILVFHDGRKETVPRAFYLRLAGGPETLRIMSIVFDGTLGELAMVLQTGPLMPNTKRVSKT